MRGTCNEEVLCKKNSIFNKKKRKTERESVFLLIKCDLPKDLQQTGHLQHIYRGSFETESKD